MHKVGFSTPHSFPTSSLRSPGTNPVDAPEQPAGAQDRPVSAIGTQSSVPGQEASTGQHGSRSAFATYSTQDFLGVHQLMQATGGSEDVRSSGQTGELGSLLLKMSDDVASLSLDELDKLLHLHAERYDASGSGTSERRDAVQKINLLMQTMADARYELAQQDQAEFTSAGGVKVAVSGHRFDTPNATETGPSPEMTEEEISAQNEAIQQLLSDGLKLATMKQGITLGDSELGFGVAPMMPLSYAGVGNGGTGMLEPLFNSQTEQREFARNKLNAFMDMLDIERDLKSQYGEDVKVFYNALDKQWTMLRPGDQFYDSDRIVSGEQALSDLRQDIGKSSTLGALGRHEIEAMLNARGYSMA